MGGWSRHEGPALALPVEGIDTDQLIPARFMSVPRDQGYGSFLLHDLRADPDFALTRHPGATILVAGRNFGCGSSREAAVYALVDAGVRAVLAPSFGDIFAANAVNNGLLPGVIAPDLAARLFALLHSPQPMVLTLGPDRLRLGGLEAGFALDPQWRQKLMNGWDDIDLTASLSEQIAAYRARDAQARPWAGLTQQDRAGLTPRTQQEDNR